MESNFIFLVKLIWLLIRSRNIETTGLLGSEEQRGIYLKLFIGQIGCFEYDMLSEEQVRFSI